MPSGSAAAMARMNGRCQTTSPMPCLTWMTAVEVTLIAAPNVARTAFYASLPRGAINARAMRTDLFDFELPPERIALRPARPRDAARLLVVRPGGSLEDRIVRDLPELLRLGDQLVVNDTRVIPAWLSGRRISRGTEPRIEATLVKRLDGSSNRESVSPSATWSASAMKARSASSGSSTPRCKPRKAAR